MHQRSPRKYLLAFPILIILAFLAYNIPLVNSHLAWRLDNLRVRILYAIKPPEQVIFKP